MKPVIEARELLALAGHALFVLIDARSGADAREKFQTAHLKGAFHVHLEEDLSDIKEDLSKGGRHPLPAPSVFGSLLGQLGITSATRVVVYDDQGGANAAARFWWMLRAAGHQQVQVLNGGMQSAIAAGFPVSSQQERPQPVSNYPVTTWGLPTCTMEQVASAVLDNHFLVVDVREEDRHMGLTEPIDTIAGHIPGTANLPYTWNLDENMFLLKPFELREMFTELLGNRTIDQVIVHCGSGVTACHTLLAMDYAGLGIPAIYTGSWSEWSRNGMPMGRSI